MTVSCEGTQNSDVVLAAESDRLASLYGYGLLDTPPEEGFDRIAALAAEICGTPMALVSLIDADRQWFKARIGVALSEAPRALSLCQHAIAQDKELWIIPDTLLDGRFATNPLVTGEPGIRFYAGAVLRDDDGRGLGALCVLDTKARRLSPTQLAGLTTLGRQVTALMDLRRGAAALAHAETALGVAAEGQARRAVITLDRELRIAGWSGDAERLYGFPAAAVKGRLLSSVLATGVTVGSIGEITETIHRDGRWEGDVVHHRRDGSPVRVHVRIDPCRDAVGRMAGYISRNADLTSPDIDRLCHETYTRIVTAMANGDRLNKLASDLCRVVEQAFEGARASLMAVDRDTGHLVVVAAPSMSGAFTHAFDQVPVGPHIGTCGRAAHLGRVVVSADIRTDPAWDGWRGPAIAEGLRSCWSHPIIGPVSTVLGTFAVYHDEPHDPGRDELQLVTTLAALAAIVLTARIGELGTEPLDELTGLLTRAGFDRVLHRLNPDAPVCIVAVGIDRFGLVNRQYGLEVGDHALCQIAERVREVGAEAAIGARFASDQFVLLSPQGSKALHLADRLVKVIRHPFVCDGHELWLTASVGVAQGPGGQARAVLHAAVAAAGRARRLGGDQALGADLSPRDLATSSLALVGALHRAVASGDLTVEYQPQVTIASGRVESLEALVRWTRADGTAVAPSVFIPLAEEIGLIGTIGEQVLRRACSDAAGWNGPGQAAPRVSVNVSGRQLGSGRLAASVHSALAHSGLAPQQLTLEVTETSLAEDLESAVAALRDVKSKGVHVSIDDFGVGYSSLGYLSRFPIDELKIDRSFVSQLGKDMAADAIVRCVIALSHSLGLRCVAEGVEHEDQLALLSALGCDAYQGFLYSRSVPNAQVRAVVEEGNKLRPSGRARGGVARPERAKTAH